MRINGFIVGVFCFISVLSSATVSSQEDDSLTLPGEVRLNKRQPPDTVLKTIGIKPGLIIGEVGAGRIGFVIVVPDPIGKPGGRAGRVYICGG